jgi:methylmalonyl-CoA mutase N-terminal domain/subunit
MTINGPAVILYCLYIAAAEKQGVNPAQLRRTIQNEFLKENRAQHAWVYPIEPALRLRWAQNSLDKTPVVWYIESLQ